MRLIVARCEVSYSGRLNAFLPDSTRLLMLKAREAKENLTAHASTPFVATLSSGETIELTLIAATFAAMTETLVGKTLGPVRKALRDAKLTPAEIDGVVMVGGATRMPQIQKAVATFFGAPPLNNLDPDQVVALGAAIDRKSTRLNSSH